MIGQRGVALVIVLWSLTVIAVITANFTTANRDGLFLARNTVERAKAEALADAGFYRAVLAMVNQEAEPGSSDIVEAAQAGDLADSFQSVRANTAALPDPDAETEQFGEFGPPTWRTNGKIYQWPVDTGTVLISIQDEAGKIDLNAATEDLLQQLFSAVGLAEAEAATLVDRLIDYRDSDQDRRPLGAEDIDYQSSDLGYGAKDRPFERADELRRVLGVTEEIYTAVAPLVTVHSGQRGIDPDVAPADVLAVLGAASVVADTGNGAAEPATGATAADASAANAARRTTRPNTSSSRQRAFTITTQARTVGGGVFVRKAIVELTGDRNQPIAVRQWEQARGRLSVESAEYDAP
jgi:general secretion pathway protein K